MGDDLSKYAEMILGTPDAQAIAAENPLYSFAKIPETISDVALRSYYQLPAEKQKLGELVGITGLGGLLSGVLGGFGDEYQNTLTNRYHDVFNRMMKGESPSIQESGLPEGLFNKAEKAANLWKIKRTLDTISRLQDLQEAKVKSNIDLEKAIKTKLLDQYLTADMPQDREKAGQLLRKMGGAGGLDIGTEESVQTKEKAPKISEVSKHSFEDLSRKYGYKFAKEIEKKKISSEVEKEDWFKKLDPASKRKAFQAKAITDELFNLADEFENLDMSAVTLAPSRIIPQTKAYKLFQRIQILVPMVVRLSGDVGNIADRERAATMQAMIASPAAGSDVVAKILREAASLFKRLSAKSLEAAKEAIQGGGEGILQELKNDNITSPKVEHTQISPDDLKVGGTWNGETILSVKRID